MNWGDHSALSGHGYLVYMIAPMYDAAVFSNPQMSQAEVQRIVEQPRTYLIAMSADTCQDKLMYIADRRADIAQLKLPIQATSENISFDIQMRAFKGDNPEQEFELGINQSGHYKCSGCSAQTSTFGTLSTAIAAQRLSVKDRQILPPLECLAKLEEGRNHSMAWNDRTKKGSCKHVASVRPATLPHSMNDCGRHCLEHRECFRFSLRLPGIAKRPLLGNIRNIFKWGPAWC